MSRRLDPSPSWFTENYVDTYIGPVLQNETNLNPPESMQRLITVQNRDPAHLRNRSSATGVNLSAHRYHSMARRAILA